MHGGRCLGGGHTCQEQGRIRWNDPCFMYLHVRFDGCICSSSTYKKCDCIIFRFGPTGTVPVMFAIETKGKSPRLSEVKEQIEFGISTMHSLLPNLPNQFRVVPVLCARRITAHAKYAALGNKIKVFGKKLVVALRRYDQDINSLA